MFPAVSLAVLSFFAIVHGQQVGTLQTETHPKLNIQRCSTDGSCATETRSVTLDSNRRWVHDVAGPANCYTGNSWDAKYCPDPASCASKCALEGVDYTDTFGIASSGDSIGMRYVTYGIYSKNLGSRVFLMQDDNNYQLFKLKNQEFTFDVDAALLPCGLNGALYFVAMDQDGGKSKYSANKAGAKYGTGYCDSKCPKDLKFVNGEANVLDWRPSVNDTEAGTGLYGSCCDELDVWEANSMAAAHTAHTCTTNGQYRCSGSECGADTGVCDKDGCDFNSFRVGDKNYFGPGKTVDTKQKITIITQFITVDNSSSGDLVEIRRIYVQNGKVIQNSKTNLPGVKEYDSVTDAYCEDVKGVFGETNDFGKKGGLKKIGEALDQGMVLVLSISADYVQHLRWLDSNHPADKPEDVPGVSRGACPIASGDPVELAYNAPSSQVVFSNIKYGPIGSTFKAG